MISGYIVDCPHGNCLGCECVCHEPERKYNQIVSHIKKMIDKCDIEMESIRDDGQIEKKPPMMEDDMWYDLQEGRHEYLSDLERRLSFILEYPEREQTV